MNLVVTTKLGGLHRWDAGAWRGAQGSPASRRVVSVRRYVGPTQSATPPGHAILVYDGDCGFCLASARWVQRRARVPLELIEFAEAEERSGILTSLSHSDLHGSAHFVTADGVEYHGGASISRSLRLVPGGWLVGFVDWPLLSVIRDAFYSIVSANRDRLSRLLGATIGSRSMF